MKLVIYTNTEYIDIFEITKDHLINHVKDLNDVVIFTNLENELYNGFKTVLYEESMPYAERLLTCMNKLESEYVLLCHDNDIIISYNKEIIDKLESKMKIENIDRVDFNAINYVDRYYESKNKIVVDDEIILINNPGFFCYSVGPSIWNREKLITILDKFKYKTYRNIEDEEVQKYTLKNAKCTNIKTIKDKSSIFAGRTFNYYFGWLHITVNGKLVFDVYSKFHLMTTRIYKKYNLKPERYPQK